MIYRVDRIRCGIISSGVLPAFGVPLRQVDRCTLLLGRQPHTAWGGRSAPVGALPPYPPKVFSYTSQRDNNTFPTSKINFSN